MVPLKVDISDRGQIDRRVHWTVEEFERLDILVNNAGLLPGAPLLDVTEREWDDMMAIDVKSVFYCCRAVLPHMLARKSGSIFVNVASIAGKEGNPNMVPYFHRERRL